MSPPVRKIGCHFPGVNYRFGGPVVAKY